MNTMPSYRTRKLSAEQRLEIIDRVREGYTHSHLALIYGVSRARIGQVANADEASILEWVRISKLPKLDPQTNDSPNED